MAVRMVWARSAAEMPVVTPSRASMVSVKAVPKREEFCCGHGKEAKMVGAFLGQGEADQAAAVTGHEVDGFRGDELGGQGEVALVFAVLVVDDDDHATGADFGERAGDIGKGRLEMCVSLGASLEYHFADFARRTSKSAARRRRLMGAHLAGRFRESTQFRSPKPQVELQGCTWSSCFYEPIPEAAWSGCIDRG